MPEIAEWLEKLGLGQYAQVFTDNDISLAVLPDLTDQDLKELGVASLGHRRQLLRAIAVLNAEASASAEPQEAAFPAARFAAERRSVTVMFSDLVGSTALSTRMDPEDLQDVIRAYQACVIETVHRYDGFIARYMGDGVLVYFGYPKAHEDGAERAVRAALELIAAVSSLQFGVLLRTRVGIATGLVVVGDLIGTGGAQERAVVGETPNLAARLQGIAQPDTVVIAEGTRRLVGNLFELEDLGPQTLKGMDEPARAWAVVRVNAVASRFEALRSMGFAEAVGREEEADLLRRRWAKAKGGAGQVILLSGEPGIGKSLLVDGLRSVARAEGHRTLLYQCSELLSNTALHPFAAALERAAAFDENDPPAAKLAKLRAVVTRTLDDDEAIWPLAMMLSIPLNGDAPARGPVSPAALSERILRTLLAYIEALARQGPILVLLEDAHWADPTSVQLLGRLIRAAADLPILVIVTYRPGFQPPGSDLAHVTSLRLNRLDERSMRTMLKRIAPEDFLQPEVRDEIIAKADGVPLFLEELTKAVLEAGDRGGRADARVAIPATLRESLAARLDRLTIAKELAQVAAVIGREFSAPLIRAVSQLGSRTGEALDQLVASNLCTVRGTPPDVTYAFRHALVQDAAYELMVRPQRREVHRRVAEALEAQFPNTVKTRPEILAHHWHEDSDPERAVGYYRAAAEMAAARSANVEAIAHLTAGLRLVDILPPGPGRDRLELPLQLLRAGALRATKGFAAQETGDASRRARELCRAVGEPAQLMTALNGLYAFYLVRSETPRAGEVAAELLALAEAQGDTTYLMIAHRCMGCVQFHEGKQEAALQRFENSLALYDPVAHGPLAFLYGTDHKQTACSFRSQVLWVLGRPEQAEASQQEALAHAESLKHLPSVAQALTFLGQLRILARDFDGAREPATRLLELSRRVSFVLMEVAARLWLAVTRRGQAPPEEIAQDMQDAMALWVTTGARQQRGWALTLLAQIHLDAGRPDEALRALAESRDLLESGGERWAEAELDRVEGVVLLALQRGEEAEAAFRRAIEVARGQGALMWELRASVTLATLWRQEGRGDAAKALVAPVYARFTEGFDYPDLKEARALLES